MSRPLIRVHNVETNEIIDREMNDAEFSQYELDIIVSANQKTEIAEKAAARQSILNRLGITEEEAKLLLG